MCLLVDIRVYKGRWVQYAVSGGDCAQLCVVCVCTCIFNFFVLMVPIISEQAREREKAVGF